MLTFAATVPGNHTESDDGYAYAGALEGKVSDSSQSAYLHLFHLLYLPLGDAVYHAASWFDADLRAFDVLIAISVVTGGVAMTAFGIYLRFAMGFSVSTTLAGTIALGGAYGYWRYSCEAEAYMPALAAVCVLLAWSLGRPALPRNAIVSAVVATACLTLHFLSLLYVFVFIPVFWCAKSQWRHCALYLAITITLTAGVYATAFTVVGTESDIQMPTHDAEPLLSTSVQDAAIAWAKKAIGAPIGLGQSVIATNFIFGFADVRQLIKQLFPSRFIGDDIFLGQSMPRWNVAAALISFFGLTMVAIYGIVGFRAKTIKTRREVWLALGVAATAALFIAVFVADSMNCEYWILSLPITVTIITLLILESLEQKDRRLPLAASGLLCLHSLLGGILPIQGAESSFSRAKNRWLIENVQSDDIVLTSTRIGCHRYLAYYSPSDVYYLDHLDDETATDLLAAIDQVTGRIFFWHFVADGARTAAQAKLGKQLSTRGILRVDDPDVKIYEYIPEGAARFQH